MIRYIRPAWLTFPQAEAYCSLPPYILRELLVQRLLRRVGTKIERDPIDRLLLEATLSGQPISWEILSKVVYGELAHP